MDDLMCGENIDRDPMKKAMPLLCRRNGGLQYLPKKPSIEKAGGIVQFGMHRLV